MNSRQDLPQQLAQRMAAGLPGRAAQTQFSPSLSYGRHFAAPPSDARTAAVMALLYPDDTGEWILPLTQRPEGLVDHGGQICLPGGASDGAESCEETSLRELHEELGIDSQQVEIHGQLSPLYVFNSNFHVTPVVASAPRRPAIQPYPAEVERLIELPVNQLLDSRSYRQMLVKQGPLTYSAPCIAWRGFQIWGATAVVLGELIRLLRDCRLGCRGGRPNGKGMPP